MNSVNLRLGLSLIACGSLGLLFCVPLQSLLNIYYVFALSAVFRGLVCLGLLLGALSPGSNWMRVKLGMAILALHFAPLPQLLGEDFFWMFSKWLNPRYWGPWLACFALTLSALADTQAAREDGECAKQLQSLAAWWLRSVVLVFGLFLMVFVAMLLPVGVPSGLVGLVYGLMVALPAALIGFLLLAYLSLRAIKNLHGLVPKAAPNWGVWIPLLILVLAWKAPGVLTCLKYAPRLAG